MCALQNLLHECVNLNEDKTKIGPEQGGSDFLTKILIMNHNKHSKMR